jgi:hypothetical protein
VLLLVVCRRAGSPVVLVDSPVVLVDSPVVLVDSPVVLADSPVVLLQEASQVVGTAQALRKLTDGIAPCCIIWPRHALDLYRETEPGCVL